MTFTAPTPYPDVNAVLHLLLAGARDVLGDHFYAMYLYGSLAGGDFDLERSDIDFVVVTADELPGELIPALEALHARILASGLKWAPKLEGCYIPRRVLRRHNPADPPYPCTNEGKFYVGFLGSDWVIQRHLLRERGIVVAGPSPRELIDPVSSEELCRAVRETLYEWWLPMLDNPTRLRGGEYQAYAVLTMCRALYTLEHGAIASKLASARWARQGPAARWAALIGQALAWRPGGQMDGLDETVALIRYTVSTGS